MKTAFLPTVHTQFVTLPRRYTADGFWDGICRVDPGPAGDVPGDDLGTGQPSGGGSGEDPVAQLEALRAELAAKDKALGNARQVERRYKQLEAIVGDTNPEKLQELRDAETKLKQQQEESEKRLIEAKNSIKSEYEQQIQELNKQSSKLMTEQQKVAMTFDLFRHFNNAEGDGEQFEGFVTLSEGLFHRTDSGEIQVKDSAGRLVTTKDEAGNLRPATPREFMKLLVAGKLDDEFDIKNASLLKMTFAPYNKAMGAGLPSGNAGPMPKDLASLSQSQLGSLVFGS